MLPADAFGGITLEALEPTIEFVLLRIAQRQRLVLEAVPELTDELESLVDREAAKLVAGELHTASLARQCRSDKADYGN